MTDLTPEGFGDKLGFDRIVFFSDAVIAIAITLLVIELGIPEIVPRLAGSELVAQVREMWPQILGFVVSFWVIATYWMAHHRIFRLVHNYDRALMLINLLFLMCIAFMPFTTGLLFGYPGERISVVMYAGNVIAIGLTLFGLWAYSTSGHRFIAANVPSEAIGAMSRALLVTPAVFLLSVLIAIVNPVLAMYSWLILIPLYLTPLGRGLVSSK